MQNNQNFLEKMQGLLSTQSNPQTEMSNNESVLKSEELPEEYSNKTPIRQQPLSHFQGQVMQSDANFMLDPHYQGMFGSEQQYRMAQDESLVMNEVVVQEEQAFPAIDPNLMTPEYFQMFNQFYSVFVQLQQQIQEQQIDPTNENFMNVMTQFFLQMIQQQTSPLQHSKSPIIDYNNLPLASIPESKESILEENSGWHNTVQTKQTLMTSSQAKEHCSCCSNCIESKLQQCSNFNAQLNSDTFIQKSEVSSATSQILGLPFSNSYTPSPNINRVNDMYQLTSLQVNQNLNQIFQQQQQQNNMAYYMNYPIQQQDLINDEVQQQQYLQQYMNYPQSPQDELIILSPSHENIGSPTDQQQLLSPEQMKQTRLIEYMIDNNDFSNYKHRRCVIKGERMSRTLSRSGNKSSVLFMHRQQSSIPNINPMYPSQQNSIYQQIIQDECPLSEMKGPLSPVQDYQQREPFHFFSPQLPSKQSTIFFTAKNSFEDTLLTHQNEQMLSPIETNGERKRKKTQDRIKEIRKLNEQQREAKPLKKSQLKKNVFEIKDLKKSKSKKVIIHNRKQSYNVIANKENHKLLQSNYQSKYELSQENIVNSDQYDLINEQSEELKKEEVHTFKSLKSVWMGPPKQLQQLLDSKRSSVDQASEIASPSEEGIFDLRTLPQLEHAPGQEIHIIKKPHQTDELKKIQERLNKYYKDKKKDEEDLNKLKQMKNQNQQENETVMSMTKTLSSFKSLMMKTMSQMSIQQDNNIQHQYVQGHKQRMLSSQQNHNGSMNVSSIQDDFSVGGEFSENLTRIISPRHLYNGQSVKHRNIQHNPAPVVVQSNNSSLKNLMLSPQAQSKQHQQSATCLPNVLFFKNNERQEDTLSLKYNSRQHSLCQCGKAQCICEQKKDLLGHFQNFLHEMDKQTISKNMRDSIMPSPITTLNNNTNDFMNSHYPGRSSSQHSIRGPIGSARQSTSVPKMKRFSSGSALLSVPIIQTSKGLVLAQQHCQSTQNILSPTINIDNSPYSRNSVALPCQPSLQKLDTNKEEEIRLLNMENDMMHKAFIQKSHRLNLEQNQRTELLLRIQKYKEGQVVRNNNSDGTISSCFAGATTQNSSQTSLEERRKVLKIKKRVEKIQQSQSERVLDLNC